VNQSGKQEKAGVESSPKRAEPIAAAHGGRDVGPAEILVAQRMADAG
jgi:hypothetical protein